MSDEWEKSQGIRINGLRAQVAKRDETIAELQAQVADLWTQLAERDATVASLVERLTRCTCTDDFGNVTE